MADLTREMALARQGPHQTPTMRGHDEPDGVVSWLRRMLYSKDQPRDPAGTPTGGQWTGGLTSTPEFKAWFKDSKVVDAHGKPKVVYHGTGKDFGQFDLSHMQRPGFGYGFHFAENPKTANFYAEQWSDGTYHGKGDVLLPVYLSIQKPFTGNYYAEMDARGIRDHQTMRESLIESGYDGIRYEHGTEGVAWVVFQPTQIKSAITNVGTFDPKNPLLTMQDGRFAYSKDQPRDPAGTPTGGQWTEGPAGPQLMRPVTPGDADRLKGLKIPPAYTNIKIADDPDGLLQATAVDSKDRVHYYYSAVHTAAAKAEKFARLQDFREALPGLRERIAQDMQRGQPKREEATALYLIERTGIRPGSEAETGADEKAYGATTLLAKHVKVEGNTVHLNFPGKSGQQISKTVEDAKLAGLLATRLAKRKPDDPMFDTNGGRVLRYLKTLGGDFLVKDFRTYHGTAVALKTMRGMRKPKNAAQFKKAQREVKAAVAAHLGNTPAVAFKDYIDPAVWASWTVKDGK